MNKAPVFKVDVETETNMDEYERYYVTIENVIPESLSLICPHCGVYSSMRMDKYVEREGWKFDFICSCPHCEKTVFVEAEYLYEFEDSITFDGKARVISMYPLNQHVEIDENIPDLYRKDFREAQLTLPLSPKASAALSRRILQTILREEYGIKKGSLSQEIDTFLGMSAIPSYINEAVDAVRTIGNFAAHPIKNTRTGEVVDVEPGEAEWLIEVLDTLFDFTFLQPAKLAKRRERLNEKLAQIGKPPMKG